MQMLVSKAACVAGRGQCNVDQQFPPSSTQAPLDSLRCSRWQAHHQQHSPCITMVWCSAGLLVASVRSSRRHDSARSSSHVEKLKSRSPPMMEPCGLLRLLLLLLLLSY